jgi:hypothetical protein
LFFLTVFSDAHPATRMTSFEYPPDDSTLPMVIAIGEL